VQDPAKIKQNAPVVFLQHGLLGSAEYWCNHGELSPAFVLARAGYDVWLGNSRGSKYSRRHVSLNPNKDVDFWKFSWQEMAMEDLPAMIEYTRKATG
jgi:lysosomal acid lipase/cholesteryl ester hydrolase